MSTPANKIRIGSLQATIWRNAAEKGDWYSVQLARGYKTDDGWRDSDRLGSDDLLPAAKLLDQAHSWIVQQLAADAKSRRDAEHVAL